MLILTFVAIGISNWMFYIVWWCYFLQLLQVNDLDLINQISNIFDKVRESFQYLISSWKTIIEFSQFYKRLKAFESILKK